jgi:hypothetical protein
LAFTAKQTKEVVDMRRWWSVIAAVFAVLVLGVILYGTVLAPNPNDHNVPGATTGSGKGSLAD